MTAETERGRSGLLFALAAYGVWGGMPLYWRALSGVPAIELVSVRVLGSVLFAGLLVVLTGGARELRALAADRRALASVALSTLLIGANWWLFVWVVTTGRVTEASLGYYLNPLLSVALGRLVLGEKLRPLQLAGVALAAVGVGWLAFQRGALPWPSLVLAATFGTYGLVRKRAKISPVAGLFVESALLAPVALVLLARAALQPGGAAVVALDAPRWALLAAAGAATGVPMLFFTAAARRLRLSTLGIVQFLSPTLQLATAVGLFGEPFGPELRVAFGCMWSAVALYALDSLHSAHAARR